MALKLVIALTFLLWIKQVVPYFNLLDNCLVFQNFTNRLCKDKVNFYELSLMSSFAMSSLVLNAIPNFAYHRYILDHCCIDIFVSATIFGTYAYIIRAIQLFVELLLSSFD